MTSEVERRPAPVAPAITGPSLLSRVYGFGSIYGKTMRDSRRAVLVIAIMLGLLLVGVSFAIVTEFNTPESRAQLVAVVAAVPAILAGLAGKAVNVGTLGGYLQYKYGTSSRSSSASGRSSPSRRPSRPRLGAAAWSWSRPRRSRGDRSPSRSCSPT